MSSALPGIFQHTAGIFDFSLVNTPYIDASDCSAYRLVKNPALSIQAPADIRVIPESANQNCKL
jgi:hypothetical protein